MNINSINGIDSICVMISSIIIVIITVVVFRIQAELCAPAEDADGPGAAGEGSHVGVAGIV